MKDTIAGVITRNATRRVMDEIPVNNVGIYSVPREWGGLTWLFEYHENSCGEIETLNGRVNGACDEIFREIIFMPEGD